VDYLICDESVPRTIVDELETAGVKLL